MKKILVVGFMLLANPVLADGAKWLGIDIKYSLFGMQASEPDVVGGELEPAMINLDKLTLMDIGVIGKESRCNGEHEWTYQEFYEWAKGEKGWLGEWTLDKELKQYNDINSYETYKKYHVKKHKELGYYSEEDFASWVENKSTRYGGHGRAWDNIDELFGMKAIYEENFSEWYDVTLWLRTAEDHIGVKLAGDKCNHNFVNSEKTARALGMKYIQKMGDFLNSDKSYMRLQ